MREALAHAMSGPINLDEQEWERPIDRLHALAAASRSSHLSSLGMSFLAARGANRPDQVDAAISKLADLLCRGRIRPPARIRLIVSKQAVHEGLWDFCPRCQGAGEIPDSPGLDGAQRMRPCPPAPDGCSGSRKRRYNDRERAEGMGVGLEDYRALQRHLERAIGILHTAEGEATQTAKRLLDRYY